MRPDVKKITVLLVEDSEADVFFFQRALGKTNIPSELIIASDGKEALAILGDTKQEEILDVVFLDLKLPYFGGFDVLRWVQARKLRQPLPIVVLSGSAHGKDKKLAEEMGAAEYLVKPISAEILQPHLIPRENTAV